MITAQRDFSAGQVDPNIRRNEDHPFFKAGVRTCINYRQLNTKGLANRFGRSAQFFDGPRVEEILMGPGFPFVLCFAPGQLQLRQMNGTVVFTATGLPWTAANTSQIVWAIFRTTIYICFPGMQPRVITWAQGTTTFTIALYDVMSIGNTRRAAFYRISPQGITLQPIQTGGGLGRGQIVNLVTSDPVFVAGMVGTYIRYVNREILITAVADPMHATGEVWEGLFHGQHLTFGNSPVGDLSGIVSVGDVVIGQVSGARGQVTAVSGITIDVQLLSGTPFEVGVADGVTSPGGGLGAPTAQSFLEPAAVTIWDEEIMNAYRGWPMSCFADQNRLGLTNFPAVPRGVVWSAINAPNDLYVPTDLFLTADNAIFELAPGQTQVYFVVPGAESDEFVFGDNATYWIPINVQNPLSATGVVVFNRIDEGAAPVQPRFFRGAIIYINAAANQVRAIAATGAYNRPYEARDLSELHRALLIAPIAIAAPDGDNPLFSERYVYILNGNGSLAVAYVDIENGQLKSAPGFVIMNGIGNVTWVASRLANVWFTTNYPGATGPMAELLDPTRFMDASINVNALPAALVPPTGKGPLWWAPGQPVSLLDNGLRQMGIYQVDANGFIIPQFIGGENLASPQLVAGQPWTATIEPFIPSPGPGQDTKQRMIRRRVARMSSYFNNSTGFLFVVMYSGPVRPSAPPQGTVIGSRRIPTYLMGDDATQSAPLRNGAEFWRPKGRSYDPRVAIIKDTVGPYTLLELGTEVTV
jgi:hypothetical protein